MTPADIVSTCKRYDTAMEQQRINLAVGEVHTVLEKVEYFYLKCGKPCLTAAHCWKRKRYQQIEQLKRAGKCRDPQKSRKESKNKSLKSRPEQKGVCFVCGTVGHRALECPDRVETDKDGKKRMLHLNRRQHQRRSQQLIGIDLHVEKSVIQTTTKTLMNCI